MDLNLDFFKKSKNIWGTLIVVEVLFLGWFYYKVYSPKKQKISELRETINNEQIQLQKYRSRLKNFTKVKAEADSIEQLWNQLNKILPSESQVPQWIKKIALTGIRNHLEFTMFKPMPTSTKGFYTIYPIEIDLVGSYHNFGKFVEDLTNSPQVTKIANLDVTAFTSKDFPEFTIKAHFTLQVYVFTGQAVKALLHEGE